MCGICGITWSDPALVERMATMIAHRGPDDWGVFADDAVSLAHRRLSIIDLSPRGHQPMGNEDGTVQVTYNGEIYNFAELRAELEALGHEFRSHTDSEVIVHGWEEWGSACVERFNGMFALAVWDQNTRELFIARDRIGIKPLYYSILPDGRIAFASELKAILACEEVSREIDPQAVYEYIGYEFVAAPRTIFRHVRKLPAGHRMIWRPSVEGVHAEPTIECYWRMPMKAVDRTEEEHEAALREGLQRAVERRLVSDVPLGVFLSGGLDSSALVAMMSALDVKPLDTFSLYYEDATFSELPYARFVADKFGTRHHEVLIDPISPELIESSIWHLDEPMTDLSAIPFFILCKKVKEHVTVCLSGEGGDEILAGYDRFKASRAHAMYAAIPAPLRRHIVGAAVARLRDRPQKKGAVNMLKRFVEGGLLPPEGGHLRWQYFSSPRLEDSLFSPALKREVTFDPFAPIRRSVEGLVFEDRIGREIYLDATFTMTNSLLRKVDKMSMAHALEVRVPFLDHEFLETCGSIPNKLKLRGFETKAIFRRAMKGILPDHIRGRGKQGYSLPIKNWLREQLREYMIDTLHSSALVQEMFDLAFIDSLIEEHVSMRQNHNHILWALINLAVWHRLFIEELTPTGSSTVAPTGATTP